MQQYYADVLLSLKPFLQYVGRGAMLKTKLREEKLMLFLHFRFVHLKVGFDKVVAGCGCMVPVSFIMAKLCSCTTLSVICFGVQRGILSFVREDHSMVTKFPLS
jgi:hypothetical protein